MTRWALALKGLSWHGRSYFAVAASIATTCAVICGALLVGDSVRQSLREVALQGHQLHLLLAPHLLGLDVI